MKRARKIVIRDLIPLLGWAILLQLLFQGPWMPHRIDLYASLCYLLIVFGGRILATDAQRVVLTFFDWKQMNGMDIILALRGIGTGLLILLEIATTLWDLLESEKHGHFPLFCRVAVLMLCLPLFYYTSGRLLRQQDRAQLERRMMDEPVPIVE